MWFVNNSFLNSKIWRTSFRSSSIQYGDRSKGVITSGQFAISFNTSSASAFPVENAAPGFRVELTLVKSKHYKHLLIILTTYPAGLWTGVKKIFLTWSLTWTARGRGVTSANHVASHGWATQSGVHGRWCDWLRLVSSLSFFWPH